MRWLLLQHIDSLDVGESAVGRMTFDPTLPLFQDHFPEWPVVPGVLLLESAAQLAGKLIGYSVRLERGDWPFPILSMMENVKFRRFVRPGEDLELRVQLEALREESAVVKARVLREGKVVAQARQIFVFNAVPLEDPAACARLEAVEGSELARLWPDFSAERWTA